MKQTQREVRISVSNEAVLLANRANLSARAVVNRLLALYVADVTLQHQVAHFNVPRQAAASSAVFGEEHAAAAVEAKVREAGKASAAAIARARLRPALVSDRPPDERTPDPQPDDDPDDGQVEL